MHYMILNRNSKPKNHLGRGETVLVYNTMISAIQQYLLNSLNNLFEQDLEGIVVSCNKESELIQITTEDMISYEKICRLVHDSKVWLVNLSNISELTPISKDVKSDRSRYNRSDLEATEHTSVVTSIDKLARFTIIQPPSSETDDTEEGFEEVEDKRELPGKDLLEEITMMGDLGRFTIHTRISNYRHGYGLAGWLSNLLSFFGKTDIISLVPTAIYKSYFGGYICIYKDDYTENETLIGLWDDELDMVGTLSFQDGCPCTNGINGFALEDVINILSWRIDHVNELVFSNRNVKALRHLNEAKYQLELRTEERAHTHFTGEDIK